MWIAVAAVQDAALRQPVAPAALHALKGKPDWLTKD
jgi:hypothetical protein